MKICIKNTFTLQRLNRRPSAIGAFAISFRDHDNNADHFAFSVVKIFLRFPTNPLNIPISSISTTLCFFSSFYFVDQIHWRSSDSTHWRFICDCRIEFQTRISLARVRHLSFVCRSLRSRSCFIFDDQLITKLCFFLSRSYTCAFFAWQNSLLFRSFWSCMKQLKKKIISDLCVDEQFKLSIVFKTYLNWCSNKVIASDR